jgi:hypothetical protein
MVVILRFLGHNVSSLLYYSIAGDEKANNGTMG